MFVRARWLENRKPLLSSKSRPTAEEFKFKFDLNKAATSDFCAKFLNSRSTATTASFIRLSSIFHSHFARDITGQQPSPFGSPMATATVRTKWLKEVNAGETYPYKFMPDEKTVFCKICEKTVTVSKKSQLEQHHKSEKHKKNTLLRGKRTAAHVQLEELVQTKPKVSRSNIIGKQLTVAALSANIPWNKLRHPQVRDFLESNIDFTIPDETTLKRVHLPECFEDAVREIRRDLENSPLWLGTDETTDSQGRYVVNVVAGKLDAVEYHSPYLVECTFLEKTDAATIARVVMDTLRSINPNFDADQFKLFLSDEMVREMFKEVNCLIATVKKIFLKAPSRVVTWKQTHPDLSLPPEPILTRWGIWLEAALFYAKNYAKVKTILDKLDPDDALSIEKGQELFQSSSLEADLAFIAAHLSFLPPTLMRLEERGLPLIDALAVVDQAQRRIDSILGEKGDRLKCKFDAIMQRNPGINILRAVERILKGEGELSSLPCSIGPGEVGLFKFCPITSVDVERSFSIYKNILSDQRQQLTQENIKKIIVTNCFYNR